MVPLPPPDAALVFGLVAVALALFVTEVVPPDVTAIGVLVALAVLEPYSGVTASTAIAGFASPAVVTILAMFILSAGVQETGVVSWLGVRLGRFARGSESRLLAATLSSTGLAAGLVNNTPVVAVFVPMIGDLADDLRVSPSKFLMPLSFAAMLGGTLTLVGTSLNLLASDISADLLGHPIGMFEFSALGLLVFGAGLAYLLTVGRWLTPARIAPASDPAAAFDIERHLAQVRVREGSPLVGKTATDALVDGDLELDLDVLQVERETTAEIADDDPDGVLATTTRETFVAAADRPLAAGDVLTVRANRQVLNRFAEAYDCQQLPREGVDPASLASADHRGMLVAAVVPPASSLVGATPAEAHLREQFDTTVLAVRQSGEVVREGLDDRPLAAGDTLLVQTTETALSYLLDEGDLLVTDEAGGSVERPAIGRTDPDLGWRAPVSVGILLAAVLVAAFTPLAIPVTALGGVVAMIATGCLRASDAYDAVSWNVIFLLVGALPLGIALDATGGAAYVGDLLAGATVGLPLPLVLAVVYLAAGLLAAVITPVATIVVFLPITIDLAGRLGVEGFPFVLATLFGASAAYVTPIGYQTNLMVYGPGGYRFSDFARVGFPLQALLAVVTTVGIIALFPT